MIICIPARLNSTRLPGKALLDFYGEPLIKRVWENCKSSGFRSIVCTSRQDHELAEYCIKNKIPVYQGELDDPMGRFIEVADIFLEENIVRVTGDNPFTNMEILLTMATEHFKNQNDYTYTNTPRGTRPEIIRLDALRELHRAKKEKGPKDLYAANEYLTYELMRFKKQLVPGITSEQMKSDKSYTIDTMEDFIKVEKIYKELGIPKLDQL